MSSVLSVAVEDAIAEKDRLSRTADYLWNFDAWHQFMTGGHLWSKQREIADALKTNKNVAVKAAHGMGKSYLVAALICWWVDTRYPHAFVASTAPSQAQIGGIVWRELRKMYSLIERRYKEGLIDHKLPGKISADTKNNEWKDSNGQLIGFGRKPPDGKEDDNFQGIHDAHVLAVGDEAVGLSAEMIDALGNITSNEGSRRIIIANPTNPASYMGKLFREDTGAWALCTISVFDSPNFTDEKDEVPADILDKLTGPQYVEDKKKEYGEDSARYKARVLGEFAFDLGDTLIVPGDFAVADDTDITPAPDTRPQLGVDVASFGDDKTVVYSYHDGKVRLVDSWDKTGLLETAQKVNRIARDLGADVVKMDSMGVGQGAVEELMRLSSGSDYIVVQMMSSNNSPDRKRWHNARAWWWDDFRERLRNGEIDVDPTDETLHDEAMSVEYTFAPTGGLLIEAKKDMKKRGKKSPDFADAAVMAAADISYLLNDPLAQAGLQPGDQVIYMDEFIGQRDFIGF